MQTNGHPHGYDIRDIVISKRRDMEDIAISLEDGEIHIYLNVQKHYTFFDSDYSTEDQEDTGKIYTRLIDIFTGVGFSEEDAGKISSVVCEGGEKLQYYNTVENKKVLYKF